MNKIIALLFFLFSFSLFAQKNNVGINTNTPDSSAVLDIKSMEGGVLVPRMTSVNRTDIASPATGLLVYDTDSSSFWYFDGTRWVNMAEANFYYLHTYNYLRTLDTDTSANNTKLLADYDNGIINNNDLLEIRGHYPVGYHNDNQQRGAGTYKIVAGAAPTSSIGKTVPVTDDWHLELVGWIGPLTPYHFGVRGTHKGGDSNFNRDPKAFQRFATYISQNNVGVADWTCRIAGGSAIEFVGNATKSIIGDFAIYHSPYGGNLEYAVKFDGTALVKIGKITVVGNSATVWTSRRLKHGIVVSGGSGGMAFEHVHVQSTRQWGYIATSFSGSGLHDDVRILDCGTYHADTGGRALKANWSNPVRNGTPSFSQTTTLNVSVIPAGDLEQDYSWVRIGSKIHQIKSWNIGAGTIDVFPWVKSTEIPGSLDYVIGGGYSLRGGDAGNYRIGSYNAVRSAVSMHDNALYCAETAGLISQFCTIGYMAGNHIGSAPSTILGARVIGGYTEVVPHPFVLASSATYTDLTISQWWTAYAPDPASQIEKLGSPVGHTDKLIFPGMTGVKLELGSGTVVSDPNYTSSGYIRLSNDSDQTSKHVSTSPTAMSILLVAYSAAATSFKKNVVEVDFLGPDGNGPTGLISISTQGNYTINGQPLITGYAVNGPTKLLFILDVDNQNWTMHHIATNPPFNTTANRPLNPKNGEQYFDSTVGKPIWFNGTIWVDSSGNGV